MIREKLILLGTILQINAKSASFGTNCNLDKGKGFLPTTGFTKRPERSG